jgi:DNA polymerase
MTRFFLDFETFWDSNYSLSGPNALPIDNYVMDDRFHIHGVAIKKDDQPSQWYTGDMVEKAINRLKAYPDATLIAHNMYFDGFILTQKFGIKAYRWLCTMCMGKGLFGPDISNSLDSVSSRLGTGEKGNALVDTKGKLHLSEAELKKLGEYACNDNEICAASYAKMIPNYPEGELRLIDLTLRMFIEPRLELDHELLENYYNSIVADKMKVLADLQWIVPYLPSSGQVSFFEEDPTEKIKKALMSDQQFAELLTKLNIKVPTKTSKKTGEKTTAFAKTDTGFKNVLKGDDQRAIQLFTAKQELSSTITETRSQSLLNVGKRSLPVQLIYFGTHSSRWSGGGKRNLQNLPKVGDIRKAIIAPKGYKLGIADSSQIEARLTAYVASKLAGVECELLKWFKQGLDPYCEFGTRFFGRTITKEDKFDRFVSKQCVLGLGFQMSAAKFALHMKNLADKDFEPEFCQNAVSFYRNTFPEIPSLWYHMQRMLQVVLDKGFMDFGFWGIDEKGILLPSGMHVQYHQLRKLPANPSEGRKWDEFEYFGWKEKRKQWVKVYGGLVAENLIQALDRQIVAEQMLVINERYKVVHNEHDGIICLIPDAEAEEGIQWVQEVMSTPPNWAIDFPVAAESHLSDRYDK